MLSDIKISSDVVNTICCSRTNEPFVDAQSVNCNSQHTFSLKPALEIFGRMNNGNCENQVPCPICSQTVTAYYPNLPLQSVVNAILGINNGGDQAHVAKMYDTVKRLKCEFVNGQLYPLDKA